jgi:hypothetical protein
MNPKTRSVLLAALGGMMAASVLHTQKIIDLGFGFPRGGVVEGLSMAVTGALAGLAVLFAFRKLRDLMSGKQE